MAKAIHTMIRVQELDRSIDFYDRAFGLKVAERVDFDDFTLVYLRNAENDFELELTWNHDQEGGLQPRVRLRACGDGRRRLRGRTGAFRRRGFQPQAGE